MMIHRLFLIPTLTLTLCAADNSFESLKANGHWKRLRAQVEGALAKNPNDGQALYWKVQVMIAFKDVKGANELAKKMAASQPGNADFQASLALSFERLPRTSFFAARANLGEFRKAAEAALVSHPKRMDLLPQLTSFYLHAPGLMGGDKKRGEELQKVLATINPLQAQDVYQEVDEALDKNHVGQAEVLHKKALAAFPASGVVHARVAAFYLRPDYKRPAEAVKYAGTAIALEPDKAGSRATLAGAFANLEQWKELEATLAQSEQLIPDDLSPYFAAGQALAQTGKDLPRAEKCLRKYLTQEAEGGAPDHAMALESLALVLEKSGRKPEAIISYEKALQLNPKLASAKLALERLKKSS